MARIGASISIRGDVTSAEALHIDGHVRGQIVTREGAVTIGPAARVEANISGVEVSVLGYVRGNVSATQRVALAASADVAGTLSANFILMEEGARFNGQIDMARRTIVAKVAQHRAEGVAR
jgi:cytoskeletal protein CcmA (bactofilin family)